MSAVKKIGGDKAIWIVVIALAIFSFLPVYSASSNFGANLIFSNIKQFWLSGLIFIMCRSNRLSQKFLVRIFSLAHKLW